MANKLFPTSFTRCLIVSGGAYTGALSEERSYSRVGASSYFSFLTMCLIKALQYLL